MELKIPMRKYPKFCWLLFWSTFLDKPLEIDKKYLKLSNPI